MDTLENIIAIDPGSISSGVVVMTLRRKPKLLENLCVKKKNMYVYTIIKNLIRTYAPRYAVIEDQFLGPNARSFKILVRNSGAWESACFEMGLNVNFVEPVKWQRAVLGNMFDFKREAIKRGSAFIAKKDTGKEMGQDECDAYCIGKYDIIKNLNKKRTK